jgi:hypothetical protein
MLKVRSGKNISQMTGAIHCYSLFLFIYLGSHLLLLIIFYFILVLFYEASTPLLLCGGEQADLSDDDGLMEASNEEPGIVLFVSMTVSIQVVHSHLYFSCYLRLQIFPSFLVPANCDL